MSDSWAERLERDYRALLAERDALREQVRVLREWLTRIDERTRIDPTNLTPHMFATDIAAMAQTALAQTAETEGR